MAFALDAIVNDVTYSLSDGAPFRLESAQGLAMPSVRRLTERGPRQDGDTDLGYRLEPRTITLALNFYADTYAALDGHRDTLATIFKPARGYDIKLRVTRDDGAVRQIDCHTVGPVDVRLVREERPGKLHRAVVQLRAADPTWYDPETQYYEAIAAWWLADNTIDAANVLEYVEYPSNGQVMSGSATTGSPWSLVWQTQWDGAQGEQQWTWQTGNIVSSIGAVVAPYILYNHIQITSTNFLDDFFTTDDNIYMLVSNGGTITGYRNNTNLGTIVSTGAPSGANRRWRSNYEGAAYSYWLTDIPKAAIYDVALSDVQRTTLLDSITATFSLVYEGDWYEYPTFYLVGPLSDFTIENNTTGKVLDFTGGTIAAGESWTVNLERGYQTIVDATGESKKHFLVVESSDLDWRLEPSTVVTGGTNVVVVTSGTAANTSSVQVVYHARYASV